MSMRSSLEFLKRSVEFFLEGFESRSTSALEIELKELENIFALLLLGGLVGIPTPPSFLGFWLLPFMEREVRIMLGRAERLDDVFSLGLDVLDFG